MLTKRNMTTAACAMGIVATVALAEAPPARRNLATTATLSLADDNAVPAQRSTFAAIAGGDASSWKINGPVFLRSADPEPVGEVIIKNILGYSHSRDSEDEREYELEIEYGLVQDHELLLVMPWEVGEGRIDGNGDLTLGWHWRLWEEDGDKPAFAMRNLIRIPSGVDSEGVDYMWRGLFTKTITPGQSRWHFNPFVKSVNGDNHGHDARHFQWGAAFGIDYRIDDDLLFIAEYFYSSSVDEHVRDNHLLELGLDWSMGDGQKLGLSTQIGLDGDSHGTAVGGKVSYMVEFGG